MSNIKIVILSLLMLIAPSITLAKNLGVQGQVYPIVETSMLEWIEDKLQDMSISGELEAAQQALKERSIQSAIRPAPVVGLVKTTQPRTFYFDPSITLDHALVDHTGLAFFPPGTKVNPLSKVSLTKPLLFIDGDDAGQVDWALTQGANALLILVKGEAITLMREHGERFYFDQAGRITAHLGIRQFPAKVTQAGEQLKIEEFML